MVFHFYKNPKTRFTQITINAIIFLFTLLWLAWGIHEQVSFPVLLIAIILVIISLFQLKKSLSNAPTVTLSPQGIQIHQPGTALIPWHFLSSIAMYQVKNQPVLIFKVDEVESYILATPSLAEKVIIRNNLKKFKAIAALKNNAFHVPAQIAIDIMVEYKTKIIHNA